MVYSERHADRAEEAPWGHVVWGKPSPRGKIAKSVAAAARSSKMALDDARPKIPSKRDQVLAWYRTRGAHGATCDELELITGMTHQTASARVHELMRLGKLVASEADGKTIRRPTRSGSKATVWVAA